EALEEPIKKERPRRMEAANPPIQAAAADKKGFGWLQVGLIAVVLVVVAVIAYLAYDRYMTRPLARPLAGTPVAARRGSVASTVAATGSGGPGPQADAPPAVRGPPQGAAGQARRRGQGRPGPGPDRDRRARPQARPGQVGAAHGRAQARAAPGRRAARGGRRRRGRRPGRPG